jgi:hypothetical protein
MVDRNALEGLPFDFRVPAGSSPRFDHWRTRQGNSCRKVPSIIACNSVIN